MRADYDVIIVGAGAAGLAAGAKLAQSGKRVALFEARDRVGGRIFTQHVPAQDGRAAMSVELGAEFIHGLPAVTWSLVGEAKLPAYEIQGSDLSFVNGAWPAPLDQPAARAIGEMMKWLDAHPGSDMSFAEYQAQVPTDAATAAAAANYVEGFNAADRHRIGIASLAAQQRAEDAIESDRVFHVAAGYDALMKFLSSQFTAAGGDLSLSVPVHAIEWQRGGVQIGGASAARALITVPLGVLQADTLAFSPAPGDILTQARRLAMGEVVRVTLLFRERFWRDRRAPSIPEEARRKLANLSFLFTPAEVPPTWWTPNPNPSPMLTAWIGGPRAAALRRSLAEGGDPHALPNRCLATLARVFEMSFAELQNLLVSWYDHDWSADPHARGAYSYVPAGALDAPQRLAVPVEDTLYFAGEHTDLTGHWGTVHAALGTGLRAAEQILAR